MRAQIGLVALLFASLSDAQESLQRVPVDTDYFRLLESPDKTCNKCQALLSARPAPGSCPLAIVRSVVDAKNPKESRIESVFLAPSEGGGSSGLYGRDFFDSKIPAGQLRDTGNSAVYTETILAKVSARASLAADGTVIVPKGSLIDTSLLVKGSGPHRFVIEQQTKAERFAANLGRLRQRAPSLELSVFDFAPRNEEAIRAMGAVGSAAKWRGFSKDVSKSFTDVVGGSRSLQPREVATLEARLKDPRGGVVVIYGHSDGRQIWLDTEYGIKALSVEDVRRIGAEAGGKLPPIILLNCNAQPTLASAFLDAGAPFVAATDKPLGADEAARFLDRLARAVHVEKLDVIDAYYVAQRDTMPYRLRPMAEIPHMARGWLVAKNTD